MFPRVNQPSGDDWIVRFRCQRGLKTWTRWVGVNAANSEEEAIRVATNHINTLRRIKTGQACEILDVKASRMSKQAAGKIVDLAPPRLALEVGYWQKDTA